ncbi:hypothetical protein HDU91_000292 [Kappamyces sp. JEL0680]|nr:hypothetical protein HDU91_000292 [Kappamyces sp. JEL0680]
MPITKSDGVITVLYGQGTSCDIHLYGATITSWKCGGEERLFTSSTALLDGSKAIRGGIPLVFPQFGPAALPGHESLPQHGFARVGLPNPVDDEEKISVSFTLGADAIPKQQAQTWPHSFALVYTVTLCSNTLTTALEVKNCDSVSWPFTALLHTYARVRSIRTTHVQGLTGYHFQDNEPEKSDGTKGPSDRFAKKEMRPSVTVQKLVDRVYRDVKNPLISISTGVGSGIVISKSASLPDVVVWNPWEENALKMADMGPGEWKEFVCVEAGSVSEAVVLEPGQLWTGSQTLVAL